MEPDNRLVNRPVNLLARPGLATVSELAQAGVARISVGGGFHQVALAGLARPVANYSTTAPTGSWTWPARVGSRRLRHSTFAEPTVRLTTMKGTGQAAVLAAALVWLGLLTFPIRFAVSGTQLTGRLVTGSALLLLVLLAEATPPEDYGDAVAGGKPPSNDWPGANEQLSGHVNGNCTFVGLAWDRRCFVLKPRVPNSRVRSQVMRTAYHVLAYLVALEVIIQAAAISFDLRLGQVDPGRGHGQGDDGSEFTGLIGFIVQAGW